MPDGSVILLFVLAGLGFLLLGPIALALALGSRARLRRLEERLSVLERLRAAPSEAPRDARAPDAAAPSTPKRPEVRPAIAPVVPPVRAEPTPRPVPVPSDPSVAAPARPPSPSIEERLGTRWTVWVGGLALALGAVLLVRYSVEQGVFGPGIRVAMGFVLALGLVAGGEALRRRQRDRAGTPGEAAAVTIPGGSVLQRPDIPGIVTAAGTVALFGAIYAAHALYGFVGPEIAFVALGATGLAAMAAALLHGPTLAGLGLVGALATPLLLDSRSDNLWPLTLYLPVVAASAYGFAWAKGWRGLALGAGAGAALWSLALATGADDAAGSAAALVHVVSQLALAAFVFAVLPHRGSPDDAAHPDRVAGGALGLGTLVLTAVLALTQSEGYGGAWIAAALAGIAILAAAGFVSPPAAVGLAAAGLALCALVVLWPASAGPDWEAFPEGLPAWADTIDPGLLLSIVALASLAIAGAGALRLIGGGRLPASAAALYAGAGTLTPLAVLALAYLRFAPGAVSPSFAAAAGGLALVMTGLAAACRRQGDRAPTPALALGLGAFAAAAVASLSLGLVFAVSGGSLTVALALAALGSAGIARRLDIPALRWCVAGLGLLVAARLAWDPTVVGPDLGRAPILNWLLVGYGLPALAFGLSARLIRLPGRAPDAPPLIAQALGVMLAAFLVFFQIRHALNGGDIYDPDPGFLEQGLLALASLGFASVLTRLDRVHGSPVLRVASLGFGILAFAQAIFGLGLAANPLLTDEPVAGGLVFNTLAAAYGLPALMALGLARAARATRPAWHVLGASGVAVLLGFLAVSLDLRHAFQGAHIGLLGRATSGAEWYSYSAAWLAMGLALLAYGILRGSLVARGASAALVVVSILKVFLLDLAGLDGVLRALSFIGLGAVLIGIGLVYQRFVFAPERRSGPAATESGAPG